MIDLIQGFANPNLALGADLSPQLAETHRLLMRRALRRFCCIARAFPMRRSGYITARIIAEDLGIKPWWTPVHVREKLEQLAAR